MQRLANDENGGLLTIGVAGALWSSSAALVSIVGALNRAYDIEEGRPWWKVRLVALGLTLGVAVIVLIALSLVLVGPTIAGTLGQSTGWGAPFEWTWLALQWPVVFTVGIGLIYYFGSGLGVDHARRRIDSKCRHRHGMADAPNGRMTIDQPTGMARSTESTPSERTATASRDRRDDCGDRGRARHLETTSSHME